jgi:hypothetical protein
MSRLGNPRFRPRRPPLGARHPHPRGQETILEVFSAKTETEHVLSSALPPGGQSRLNDDLRTLLLAREGPPQPAL